MLFDCKRPSLRDTTSKVVLNLEKILLEERLEKMVVHHKMKENKEVKGRPDL
jgi:hypothetical protein